MNRRELPMLGGIAGFLQWLEELLIIVGGPLLTLGLGIALVDLLTSGALLATQPGLLFTWATSQAVGVDAQLVGSAALLAMAFRQRRYWTAAGYVTLLLPLAYVAFIASDVFATQEADGITTAQALSRLGMDSTSWIVQRSALAVALVVLSGLLRYRPPAAEASAADERAQLDRELTLEPLRAQLRTRKALGWRDVAGALTRGAVATRVESPPTRAPDAPGVAESSKPAQPADAGASMPTTPVRPTTGPGSPARAKRPASKRPARCRESQRLAVLKLQGPPAEQRIRAVLAEAPHLSVRSLTERAGVSQSAASKWRKVIVAEGEVGSDAQRAAQ